MMEDNTTRFKTREFKNSTSVFWSCDVATHVSYYGNEGKNWVNKIIIILTRHGESNIVFPSKSFSLRARKNRLARWFQEDLAVLPFSFSNRCCQR